eukprot:3508716-Prymnesium_polylepis.1
MCTHSIVQCIVPHALRCFVGRLRRAKARRDASELLRCEANRLPPAVKLAVTFLAPFLLHLAAESCQVGEVQSLLPMPPPSSLDSSILYRQRSTNTPAAVNAAAGCHRCRESDIDCVET